MLLSLKIGIQPMQTVSTEDLASMPSATLENVSNATVKMTKVEDYTTFLAEYAFIDGDIVMHFFPPIEQYVKTDNGARLLDEHLLRWQRSFPQVLSPIAESYFSATRPVLMAQYVPEMTSWYFKAGGFARSLSPETLVLEFLARLDAAVDAAYARPTSS
jgi:hypothetical protein